MTNATPVRTTGVTPEVLEAITERWHRAAAVLDQQIDGHVTEEVYDAIWRVVFALVGDDVGTLLEEVRRLHRLQERQGHQAEREAPP